MDGVLTQIGEAAADVELAGGGVLDISVQPYRAAASLACRAQRGVDEEPRDPAPLEAGQNPEGMDDQHLARCGVVRPGGLLVALRALVVEHHDPGDLLAGAGRLLCGERQVQGPGLGPGPHFLGGRVVLGVPARVVAGAAQVGGDLPVGGLGDAGVLRHGGAEREVCGVRVLTRGTLSIRWAAVCPPTRWPPPRKPDAALQPGADRAWPAP